MIKKWSYQEYKRSIKLEISFFLWIKSKSNERVTTVVYGEEQTPYTVPLSQQEN